jgi:2'-5' RNA ligase
MTKRRLFIAINLPENVKKKLAEYRYNYPQLEPKSIRWVSKFNLHITLLFIGYVTGDEMYEICNLVKEIGKKHEPFFIKLERIILGPPNRTPRMFWAQGEKSQALADLQGDLNNIIQQRSGVKYNAFRPHITLARFSASVLKSLPENIDDPFKYEIPVESIEVMQSELKRGGAEYTVLESVELGG